MSPEEVQTYEEKLASTVAHENPGFAKAIIATVTARHDELASILNANPHLIREHSKSEHRATLFHYVTSNAIEDELQLSPLQIYNVIQKARPSDRQAAVDRALATAQLLVDFGADVDAVADAYGGGKSQTPINWLVSSGHPNVAGVMGAMTDLFCRAGINLNGLENDSTPLVTALGFGHFEAATVLIKHGCLIDNALLAAAAGDLELLKSLQTEEGFSAKNIDRCTTNWFKPSQDPKAVGELALVFASMCGQLDVMRFLIDAGVDIDATPQGTFVTAAPLHTAAFVGQLASVELLIELGADPTVIEPRYDSNARGWAWEGGSREIIRRVGEYLPKFLREKNESTVGLSEFKDAVFAGDAPRTKALISKYAFSKEILNGPWFYFDAPAVVQAKSNLKLVDTLVEVGADINQKSLWWAGGFGVLHETDAELAEELIARGADVDVWSAAAFGKLDALREIVEAEPKRVHARGPDGKTALHCAKSCEVAEFLVMQGAKPNVKCWDHDSTPAQYLVASHPEVARYLIDQGCEVDIMMVAALGDISLAKTILEANPESVDATVDRKHYPSWAADHIYSWTLGWYKTPHQVAEKFGHQEMVDFLLTRGDPTNQFLNACLLRKEDLVTKLLKVDSSLPRKLSTLQAVHVCHAARNNDASLVRALLQHGFPVDAKGQHNAMPLHWAAFHGNVEMTKAVLQHNPPLEATDGDFGSTPLGWACHGSKNGWFVDSGDFAGVVRLLVDAGCVVKLPWEPIGHEAVDGLFA